MGHGLGKDKHKNSVSVEPARQSVVLLYYCHDSRGPRGRLELVEVPRHVYEFIAPFVPCPVIQRTGTYRLLGSLLLYVVKRGGEGVEGEGGRRVFRDEKAARGTPFSS